MKKLPVIILLLIPILAKTQNLAALYDEVKSSVVFIEILNLTTEGSGDDKTLVASAKQGSGVLISEDGLNPNRFSRGTVCRGSWCSVFRW